MDLTYKIISDWNQNTGSNINPQDSFISVDEDAVFSLNNSGSYSIIEDDGDIHGVYSSSNTFTLNYFYYDGGEVSLEKVLVNGIKVVAFNPQVILNSDGLPLVVFYDSESLVLRSVEKNSFGEWKSAIVDFSIMQIPINKREISIFKNSDFISAAYIVLEGSERIVRYATYSDGEWDSEGVATNEMSSEIQTVSLIEDSSNLPYVFIGSIDGIYAYVRNDTWEYVNNTIVEDVVLELDGVYDSYNNSVHLAYSDGYEVKYQRFENDDDKFLQNYQFIDFNSSSVSITVDSLGKPIISYSHIEKTMPLVVYLKIGRGTSNGEEFQTFNIDSSELGFKTGDFSDIAINNNGNIYILYLNDGVVLYDESKNASGIDSNTWLDRRARNNLKASTPPPVRNSDNSFMEFDSSNGQYYFINNCDQFELNKEVTEFSLSFVIQLNEDSSRQTIVSKNGFELYVEENSLKVWLKTIYEEIDVTVRSLKPQTITKISIVYSGYDVKVYTKQNKEEIFTLFKKDIFGDIIGGVGPFVVGASFEELDTDISSSSEIQNLSTSSNSTDSSSSTEESSSGTFLSESSDSTIILSTSSESSSSCTVEKNFYFTNYLNGSLTNLKYWKRELSYEEATYDSDTIDYHIELDPYSSELDYNTIQTGQGANHFYLKGENLSVEDLGGISVIDLITYSKFTQEERVTVARDVSIRPYAYKVKNGGINIVWSDNRGTSSEIYLNQFKSNNKLNQLINKNGTIKSSGSLGNVFSNNNIFVDNNADFYKEGVFEGDFINFTDSSNYTGKKIPIIKVVSSTMLELGVFFSKNNSELGYYIDSSKPKNVEDFNIKLTNLLTGSANPVAVSDAIGDSHVVWQAVNGGSYEIFYKRFRPSNALEQIWGNVRLTNNDGNSENPSIAIDSSSSIHVVWQDTRNEVPQIFYAFSSPVVCSTNLIPKFTRWSSDNYGSGDLLISDKLIATNPDIITDSDGVVHIVFSANVSTVSGSYDEIFYVNNRCGQFTKPTKVTNFNSQSHNPKIEVDKFGNLIVVFVSDKEGKDDVYLLKHNKTLGSWSSVRSVNNSLSQSKNPSISIDSSNIAYIIWIDRKGEENVMKMAKYNINLDSLSMNEDTIISTQIDKSLSVSTVVDDTKTLYATWEDGREFIDTDCSNTEVFKNILTNLIISSDSVIEEITDNEIEQIVNQVTCNVVSEDNVKISNEVLDDVVLTFETDNVSFVRKVRDIGNPNNPPIVLDSRSITIKIKGLSNTLAYRIKNSDGVSSWSKFFKFTEDESPNTTITDWVMSRNNGPKEICIQLYTLQGLTAMICESLFLNELELFNVTLLNDFEGEPSDIVGTVYNGSKVLTSKSYWARIEPLKLVIPEEQSVVFDVSMQGLDIVGVETELIDGVYFGKFTIQPEDKVRYIDGEAKIIPKIIDK